MQDKFHWWVTLKLCSIVENMAFKCGYCQWVFAISCDNYEEHQCFKKINFEQLIADDDDIITAVAADGSLLTPEVASEDLDEMIISLVAKRKALYDPTVPLTERTNFKKNALWKEICNSLGGQKTVEELKSRWKYLRDCYIKARRKVMEYQDSGTGRSDKPINTPGFRYYDNMTFLSDKLEKKITVTSVPQLTPSPSTSTSTTSEASGTIQETPNISGRKRKSDETQQLQKAITKILTEEPTQPLSGVDGFLLRVGEALKRLPYRQRSSLEIQILKLLHEAETYLDE